MGKRLYDYEIIGGVKAVREWKHAPVWGEGCSQAGAPFANSKGEYMAAFECHDCGRLFLSKINRVESGKTTSCGCKNNQFGQRPVSIAGISIIENWETCRFDGEKCRQIGAPFSTGNQHYKAVYECDCGNIFASAITTIKLGNGISCGCYRDLVNKTHGETDTKDYNLWYGMKARCRCPSSASYSSYGAKGVTICDRWADSYEAFIEDMGRRPTPGHTIDRIDNSKGYEPGNCRWATRREQAINRSKTVFLTAFGETKMMADWARDPRCTVTNSCLSMRVRSGMSHEKAISMATQKPVAKNRQAGTISMTRSEES